MRQIRVAARYKCHPARKVEMTSPLAADTTNAARPSNERANRISESLARVAMLDTQRECLAGELSLTLGGAISPILS
jgi:hypothetical protein